MKGYVVGAGEGVGGADPELKASAASTDGVLTLIESRTTGGAPHHVHSREDECMYVVEGSISVRCGDDLFRAGPRAFVFLPRGTPHSWDVEGDDAVVLIITVPGGFEGFLREWHDAEGSARDRGRGPAWNPDAATAGIEGAVPRGASWASFSCLSPPRRSPSTPA
jgi:mannose-6-phosphate isomerase-like protein (cupin superfamily)